MMELALQTSLQLLPGPVPCPQRDVPRALRHPLPSPCPMCGKSWLKGVWNRGQLTFIQCLLYARYSVRNISFHPNNSSMK